jgi:hypothetical protein
MNLTDLIEGVHYYINQDGYIVLTEKYHLEKGFCCGMYCLHCPYNYENVSETHKPPKGDLEESAE